MPNEIVEAIFIRQITDSDFWNIERGHATDTGRGGGSQTYIDIPLDGVNLLEPLWRFLKVPLPHDQTAEWPTVNISVKTIGAPDQESEIEFAGRGAKNKRYRITNQARQKEDRRPHAWTAANGFPTAPDNISSNSDPRIPDVSDLKIYIVKTTENNYYAGFVNQPAMPSDWPQGLGLEKLFDHSVSSDVLFFEGTVALDVPDLVRRILKAWSQGQRNVLLYGPPGTGKTHAMQLLWSLLAATGPLRGLKIDPNNATSPFSEIKVELSLTQPIRREWVTFHQNFSYEDFIVGLRPVSSAAGTLSLKPRVGKLLDLAISLDASITQPTEFQFASAVLYVDEINRGNVSRIFGEFITFMEPVYRAGSTIPLPVPLPSVGSNPANPLQTEDLERVGVADVTLPRPWFFPSELYVLASMNSVDRAVAPLDSALARRFARIEVPPDMDFLAAYLGIGNPTELIQFATQNTAAQDTSSEETGGEEEPNGDETDELTVAAAGSAPMTAPTVATASEVAWLLLYRLNYEITLTLGSDFELGHAYVMDVAKEASEDEKFRILARAWDQAIYPQLQERFINRPDELLRILRLDQPPAEYLFSKRLRPGSSGRPTRVRDIPVIKSLEESAINHLNQVIVTLRHLAGLT